MGKLNKEVILNIYSKLSIVIGLGVFLILFMYFSKLPENMFGPVEKSFFNIDFNIQVGVNVVVFNLPLIFFTLFFLYNLGIFIYMQIGEKMEQSILLDSVFYNTILSFLLIVSQFVFVYMVPESINGIIDIGLFQYEIVELSDMSTNGINFGYILATIYTFYSVFVLFIDLRRSQIDFD